MERGGISEVWQAMRKGARRGAHAIDWGKQCFAGSILSRWNSRRGSSAFVQNAAMRNSLGPRGALILSRNEKSSIKAFPSHCECGGTASSMVAELARGANATPPQVVFALARAVGMLPLTELRMQST